jgi:hypothetical protein|tara:strand:- start:4311 stop:4595 length:285 start_codon:yes stop_codon:yes gene_type:complete
MLSDRFCFTFDEYAILGALFLPLSGQIRHRNKPKGRRSKILAFFRSISSAKYSFKSRVARYIRVDTIGTKKTSVHSKHVGSTRVIVVDGELKPR